MIAGKLLAIEKHLAESGIELSVKRQPPVGGQHISQAERSIGHPLPADLREAYIDFADGFEVFWKHGRSKTDWDFGRFSLPSLSELVQGYERFHQATALQYENSEEFFDDLLAVRNVLARMMHWAVLWNTGGDGDLVCLDLDSGNVVFHEREWSFYDPPENGKIIASQIYQLIDEWGSVCFLDFPGCPGDCPAQGRPATPEYNHREYMLPSGKA